MSDEKKPINLIETADAMIWAQEFVRTKLDNGWSLEDIDEPLMVGWFASAMQAAVWLQTAALEQQLAEALKEVTDTLEVLCEGERDDPDSGIYGWDDINKRIIPLAHAALAKYRQPQEEAPELFPGTLEKLRGLGKQK